MRKSILFVGHSFHDITSSSAFFINLLDQNFSVKRISINPNSDEILQQLFEVDLSAVDCVLLWQIDRLAPYFISKQIKTIVVPMIDASWALNNNHWHALRDALIINFTFELHCRVTQLGCRSVYVKYFPQMPNVENAADGEKLSAFFWERRPDTNINANKVIETFSGALDHLHIHQVPDPGLEPTVVDRNHLCQVTTSQWLPSKSDLFEKIAASHIYIAPRYSEGIGMGFLEAMALGKTVVAHDFPAHNEYIRNRNNGILIDFSANQSIEAILPEVSSIGRNARIDAARWRRNWLDFGQDVCLAAIDEFLRAGASVEGLGSRYYDLGCVRQTTQSAYDDRNVYSSNLETLLTPTLNKVHKLEYVGDYSRALRCMRSLEEMRPEVNIYPSMRRLLELRLDRLESPRITGESQD